ncbi:rab GTPase-binding effector protein 1 [Caerostris extrusa]|uniref:Rab GTPase-binding effector protein 1 n=1 Tax=Caerostris extrusa TaxID=172846 RepID=A0AAV4PDH2_CAEEX|nr:rab GTPase-binding effector protein 1 [Caerostris extrusa]
MNPKELKTIKVKRRIIRSSVSKLIRRTDEELNKEGKNLDILNGNLTVLLEHKETLKGLDKSIECAINVDELEEEIEGSLEYTESIVLCKSRVNRYLGKLNKLQELSCLILCSVNTESERKLKTNTKLPRISLDKFSGDFLENQRLQVMDMCRMQSVLTSEQQRQIAGAKKRDERKMELERQMKNIEKKENEEFEKTFGQIKSTYDICRKELNEYQITVVVERDILKKELENVQKENDVLLGKHIVKAQQMRNEDINLFVPHGGRFYERLVKCVKDPLWKNSRTWKIRDVVLIHETLKSKLLWDLEMIKEVIERRDNLIRACVVKTAKGLFRKPVQLLYPFELEISEMYFYEFGD